MTEDPKWQWLEDEPKPTRLLRSQLRARIFSAANAQAVVELRVLVTQPGDVLAEQEPTQLNLMLLPSEARYIADHLLKAADAADRPPGAVQ